MDCCLTSPMRGRSCSTHCVCVCVYVPVTVFKGHIAFSTAPSEVPTASARCKLTQNHHKNVIQEFRSMCSRTVQRTHVQ